MNQVWDHHILIASLEPYEWRNCHINGEEVNQMYQVWDGLGFLRRLLQIYCFLTIFFFHQEKIMNSPKCQSDTEMIENCCFGARICVHCTRINCN